MELLFIVMLVLAQATPTSTPPPTPPPTPPMLTPIPTPVSPTFTPFKGHGPVNLTPPTPTLHK